jgi:hypothetical protein
LGAPGTGGPSGLCLPRGDAGAGSAVSRADVLFKTCSLARQKAVSRDEGFSLSSQMAPGVVPGYAAVKESDGPSVFRNSWTRQAGLFRATRKFSGVEVGTAEDGLTRFPGAQPRVSGSVRLSGPLGIIPRRSSTTVRLAVTSQSDGKPPISHGRAEDYTVIPTSCL